MTIYAPRATFTRPADTTAYAAGDLVANSTTAGSVIPFAFPVPNASAGFIIRSAVLKKSAASATLASFVLHLTKTLLAVTNGDNGALLFTAGSGDYLGSLLLDMATGGFVVAGTELSKSFPQSGTLCGVSRSGNVYGYLAATAAYAPASAEVFTCTLGLER